MSIDTPTLLDALDSVTAIPIIPFKGDEIDYAGHAKNINYLMQNNYLEGDRKRVIAIAGTSLLSIMSAWRTKPVLWRRPVVKWRVTGC